MSQVSQGRSNQRGLLVGGIVVIIVLILAILIIRGQQRTPQADTSNPITDGNTIATVDVLFKASQPSFIDAFQDLNNNCVNDPNEIDGILGETEEDGTVVMSLPAGIAHVIRATAKGSTAEGAAAVAVGTVPGNSCAEVVQTANTTPIQIEVK